MKKLIVMLCLLLAATMVLSAETVKLGFGTNSLTLLSSNENETTIQYSIAEFEKTPVTIDGIVYNHIRLANEGITQDKGFPELPVFNRSVIIGNNALAKLEMFDIEYRDIKLAIAPSKGVIYRNVNPDTVPYTFDSIYTSKGFYPEKVAMLSEPYILRDFRGITILTTPFAYNPENQTLRVYTSYKIRVYKDGSDSRNTLSRAVTSLNQSFASIYENHFVNWNSYRYAPVSDAYGKLLVICHTNYMSTILPYINWKKQKGIETELVQWSTIGTTAAQLQTYIQNRYNADNTITYVQIVGDAPQIPSLASGGGGSDPTFALVAGSDNYPDIFVGRFSAETTAQVTAQVNKAIVYERDATTGDTWLSKALGISDSATQTGDDSETDINHMNNIRTKLLNYGYTSVDQVYEPSATAAQVTTNVNAGRGFVNYVGHGADDYWVTTGFDNADATALTNGNKTPFIMDVACVNGNFVSLTCFAEAWMRNANGGSVAIYASTINQSWNSPMRAQDHFTDLMVAGTKTSIGGLYYNAACNMMDVYGTDGVSMFKTWHIFGDASLLVRNKTPLAMTVTHNATILIGATSVTVNTGVANARVTLTYNNTIYGVGIANSSGVATVTLTNPPATAVTYVVTATAYNRVTYVGSLQQIAGSGPFMSVETTTYADSNNSIAEYNESGRFNVTFKNIGTATATGVTATLTCATAGISLTDNTESITTLAANGSTTINNAYSFNIANNVVNGTSASFTITMVAGSETWTHNFSQTINAPSLALGTMVIIDPTGNNNGRLDPGETVTITMPLSNTGAAASPSGSATLSSPTSGITVNTGTANYTAIAAAGSTNLSFSITAVSGMTIGTVASLVFNTTAGAYTANKTETTTVGIILEDFETGNLNAYPWVTGGTLPWTVVNTGAYAGTYTAKSGAITHSQTSTLQTTRVLTTSGNLTFYYKVSSESGYDYLKFYVDGVIQNGSGFSGTVDWTQATYTLAAGTRVLKWEYMKDDSVDGGSNCAWIDNIVFPASTSPSTFNPPQNFAITASHGVANLSWTAPASGTPTGYKIYKNSTLLTTITALSYSDTAVTDGTSYSYYVKAAYSGGDSDATNTITVTPNMAAPTNLVAAGGNNVVALTWTAASGREAVGTPVRSLNDRAISNYKIYRNGTALTTVSGTSFNDAAVTNGTAYSYYVTTLYTNPAGESAASNTVSATPNVISEVIIGTGTSSTGTYDASPISVWYQSLHGQSVYTAAELTAAGIVGPINITQLGFNITALPTIAMPSFIVRMKHTTAANVASWQTATGMATVYSNASYLPTATGYNLYTLSTPFLWNGTDNIVLDTAFGLIGDYEETGTVQYTSVTSGYRYGRSDTVDQTNLFTGTDTSTYRPNVKFIFAPVQSGPVVSANPTTATASAYEGESTSSTVTITNSGNATLTWTSNSTLSTWGTVSPVSGTIIAGGNTVLTINMSSTGLAIGSYNSNLLITSDATNNPSLSVPVSFSVTASPYPVSPRYVAEWEPATGAIIAYASGFGLPYSMIADLSTRGQLYVVVTSASQTTANTALSTNGVTMANVHYINPTGVNSYWTRDYGPWTIFDSTGNMGIVDFKYNRVRPYDDVLNATLDNYFGVNYYDLPLVATGGNVMTDGNGKMMSTNLILTENDGVQNAQVTEYSYTQAQINNLVQQYLGVNEYQFYTDPLANSSIDHIDCFAKLLDVDKVIIARVPSTHANYTAIEAVVAQWQTKTSSYGTPYRIYRVDQSSNNEPYSNSFIYNKKIYVPQWNATASSYDTAAIAAYQTAMPGYTVQGYYNSSFLSDDAVHCRVNTLFDTQMIHVWHTPLTSAQALGTMTISTEITHHNALTSATTYVAYRYATSGAWQNALLTNTTGNIWTANVPTPALGQTVYYYILATDTTARNTSAPLCGASDPYHVLVNIPAPNTAPVINLPASFSFAKNGSLEQSFASYISDPDSNPLSLSVSGNTNVLAQIEGSTVTFTAASNWFGTETLTFTVSDGSLTANDTVEITVNPINTPDWVPVEYANTLATVYAVVTIDYIPAKVNDWVAAFVGGECRGTGNITLVERSTAHTTLDVNLANPGEVVTFKIYCYTEDTVYAVPEVIPMDPGTTYGDIEPVVLNGTNDVVMAIPTLSIQSTSLGAKLSWNAVPFAGVYIIYSCTEPYGEYTTVVGTTSSLTWDLNPNQERMFFRIVAAQSVPAKRTKQ
ncbi:MAG: C25 family cysteine peptidase [Candidatus Cloacimonas sp.]|jgi:agmatine/peptidylarginine deiminase|nr:C25 family cysteine peptidase [Candidatus Cloacimonas sp.]